MNVDWLNVIETILITMIAIGGIVAFFVIILMIWIVIRDWMSMHHRRRK
jgi:hypothetical protein